MSGESSSKGSGLGLLAFWLVLLGMSYPQNWKDSVFVGIFLAVLLGPPLLGLFFYFAIKVDVASRDPGPIWSEPERGVYVISSFSGSTRMVMALFLGGIAGWLASVFSSEPEAWELLKVPYAPWMLGLLVFLGLVAFDYQDAILLGWSKRTTRLTFFGIPLFNRSTQLLDPYCLTWQWHRSEGKKRRFHLELRASELGANYLSIGGSPSLQRLNEIGQGFASWSNGTVFSYDLMDEVPVKPK